MSKLLSEPRGKFQLTEIKNKKKKRVVKIPSESIEVRYTLLREGDKFKVNELFRIYKNNPYHARVKYFNLKEKIYFNRLVIFEKGSKDFEICEFTNSFGISVTNRIYSSQKKNSSIIYKGGKFWSINKRGRNSGIVRPLTWGNLLNFIGETENINLWGLKSHKELEVSKIYQFLYVKFPWIKMLNEHTISMGVNLNVIKDKKLFSYKDISRHVMKVPNNIAQMVIDSKAFSHLRNSDGRPVKGWLEVMKNLDNIQSLSKELLDNALFSDTCKMAKTLGRKVNCKWSLKRLTSEHDAWAKEIGNIVLDCEEEYDLAIRPEFLAFAEFSGYRLLMTNKQLIIEGMVQNHCVGTYIDRVNSGECAIYHVDGYTLQVGLPQSKHVEFKEFKNMQFKGKHNSSAPSELMNKVQLEFDKFKAAGKFNDLPTNYKPSDKKSSDLSWQMMNNNALPF